MGTGHRFLLVGVFILIVGLVFWIAVSTQGTGQTGDIPFEPTKTAGGNANSANSNSRNAVRPTPVDPRKTAQPTTPPQTANPGTATPGAAPLGRPLPPVANTPGGTMPPTPGGTAAAPPTLPPSLNPNVTPPAVTGTETAPPPSSPTLTPQKNPGTSPPVATAQPKPAPTSTPPTTSQGEPRAAFVPPTTRPEPAVTPPPRGENATRDDGVSRMLTPSGGSTRPAGTYVVKEGDSLAAIARELYGDDKYWKALLDANPTVDPARLFVGKALVAPPKETVLAGKSVATTAKPEPRKNGNANTTDRSAAAIPPKKDAAATPPEAPKARRATYRVASGDSLVGIAREILNDGGRWREIWELNKDRLKSPDVLPVGFELKLPESAASGNGNANAADRKPTSRSGRARG